MDVEESVRFKKLDLPTFNFMRANRFEQKSDPDLSTTSGVILRKDLKLLGCFCQFQILSHPFLMYLGN